jgi:hypothetical protein
MKISIYWIYLCILLLLIGVCFVSGTITKGEEIELKTYISFASKYPYELPLGSKAYFFEMNHEFRNEHLSKGLLCGFIKSASSKFLCTYVKEYGLILFPGGDSSPSHGYFVNRTTEKAVKKYHNISGNENSEELERKFCSVTSQQFKTLNEVNGKDLDVLNPLQENIELEPLQN